MDLVIGADIGGTSTKVALATTTGHLLAYDEGPGGNIRSSPGDLGATLCRTVERALAGHDPSDVRATHLGVSGAGRAGVDAVTATCTAALRAVRSGTGTGTGGTVEVRTDLDIAFASAATGDDGLLLLAGTGAVACSIEDLETVGRCDGTGWLLGDVGSAVWFGRRALESAAADLDRRGPATALTALVLAHHGVDPDHDPRQGLVAAVYPLAVSAHGALAPLVVAAAETGDPVARQIVDDGVDGLVRTAHAALTDTLSPRGAVSAVGGGGGGGDAGDGGAGGGTGTTARLDVPRRPAELVFAGGLLTARGPVRTEVRRRLTRDLDLPARAVHDATAPVAGAVRLAVRSAGAPDLTPEQLGGLRTRVTSWTPAGEGVPQT